MEPPSSDDSLAVTINQDSYLIVTRPEFYPETEDTYYICACWAGKGVTYLGRTGTLGS